MMLWKLCSQYKLMKGFMLKSILQKLCDFRTGSHLLHAVKFSTLSFRKYFPSLKANMKGFQMMFLIPSIG